MTKKILIVDDDEDLLHLLTVSFESLGYQVVTFLNGQDAINFLKKGAKELSLLILDRMLPDMDGIDIMREYRQKQGDTVPILILSTLSSEKDVLEGLKKGAVDYIAKPFSVNVLLQKARKLINHS